MAHLQAELSSVSQCQVISFGFTAGTAGGFIMDSHVTNQPKPGISLTIILKTKIVPNSSYFCQSTNGTGSVQRQNCMAMIILIKVACCLCVTSFDWMIHVVCEDIMTIFLG